MPAGKKSNWPVVRSNPLRPSSAGEPGSGRHEEKGEHEKAAQDRGDEHPVEQLERALDPSAD